jgi:hypothetical protein
MRRKTNLNSLHRVRIAELLMHTSRDRLLVTSLGTPQSVASGQSYSQLTVSTRRSISVFVLAVVWIPMVVYGVYRHRLQRPWLLDQVTSGRPRDIPYMEAVSRNIPRRCVNEKRGVLFRKVFTPKTKPRRQLGERYTPVRQRTHHKKAGQSILVKRWKAGREPTFKVSFKDYSNEK